MCVNCASSESEVEARVTSLADFSSHLMDAFTASDGQHKAVVVVDGTMDAFQIDGIEYDAQRQCIVIRVSGAYIDAGSPRMRKQIEVVNKQ